MPALACALLLFAPVPPTPPAVGAKAPGFVLSALHGGVVRLDRLRKDGPVVLVVLRGWPGYQCPFCTKQVAEYMGQAADFAKAGADVVFVYPGPKAGLNEHAEGFIADHDVPKGFHFTLDPDYVLTQRYGLRWDAPKETAYPSTFVIGRDGRVVWEKVSLQHGDRAAVADVLAAIPAKA